jgi:enoyl-CoA hydratase/carnithine racemase
MVERTTFAPRRFRVVLMTEGPPDAGDLSVAVERGVATLWLNRPAKRNAVTYEMWAAIAHHCGRLAGDPAVRMLVVRGAGGHFCAGADIAELGGNHDRDYQQANEAAEGALAGFPKPTLAVVTGACVGGGVGLATACDLRLADTTARIGITPAGLGLVYPSAATERVVRLAGPSAAKHLLFTAELIGAERAARVGLVDEVHDPAELPLRVAALSDLIARWRSLLSQMASKEMVDAVATRGAVDAAISARWRREFAASADPAEGIAAFLERREPRFTWTPAPSDPV